LKKYRTLEQTETAQARAVRFAENVLEDSDLADELESLTPEQYADRKGIVITNQGEMKVANGNGDPRTKSELLDEIEEATSTARRDHEFRESDMELPRCNTQMGLVFKSAGHARGSVQPRPRRAVARRMDGRHRVDER
jgi:hypothetical protein